MACACSHVKHEAKADNFVYQNKKAICEGMSAAAVYDQLLKPSSVCWCRGRRLSALSLCVCVFRVNVAVEVASQHSGLVKASWHDGPVFLVSAPLRLWLEDILGRGGHAV